MKLRVELGRDSYDITIEKNAIKKAGELFNLNRKVMIVTDSGVPEEYGDEVYDQCKEASITVIPEGEENKNFEMIETILGCMIERGFTRGDAVVAVGGGVVGDMAGFAASIYMRGIDFYNIPTTVLSQMDSSIGGKTAVDFKNYKNAVGSFYQPKGVIIDPVLIETLPDIEVASGLAESVKMAATFDEELFKLFETEDDPVDNYEEIVTRSLMIKKKVVEEDAKETGASLSLVTDPHEAVKDADIVVTDTWASMGQEAEHEARKKIFAPYQVNKELLEGADKRVIVMHCLPAYRGEEITEEVLEANADVIFDEAENRLHTQKAIMALLMGN